MMIRWMQILLLCALCGAAWAQAPAVEDRKLTTEELRVWQSLEAQILDRQQRLQAAQKRMLDLEAEDPGEFEAAARVACAQMRRLNDLAQQAGKWQEAVKRRANCLACLIDLEKRMLVDPPTPSKP